jgi:hypothetical protein
MISSRQETLSGLIDPAGRRIVVRSLAGISASTLALFGLIDGDHAARGKRKPRRARVAIKKKGKSSRVGPPGPVGPAGPPGPAASLSITLGSRVEFDVAAGAANDGMSTCAAGVAIGTNMQLTNSACAIVGSERSGSDARTWVLTIECPGVEPSAGNVVQAICLA